MINAVIQPEINILPKLMTGCIFFKTNVVKPMPKKILNTPTKISNKSFLFGNSKAIGIKLAITKAIAANSAENTTIVKVDGA